MTEHHKTMSSPADRVRNNRKELRRCAKILMAISRERFKEAAALQRSAADLLDAEKIMKDLFSDSAEDRSNG